MFVVVCRLRNSVRGFFTPRAFAPDAGPIRGRRPGPRNPGSRASFRSLPRPGSPGRVRSHLAWGLLLFRGGDGHRRAQNVCLRCLAGAVPRISASESRRTGPPSGWGCVAMVPGYRALAGIRSTIVHAEVTKWVQRRVDRNPADAVRSASVWRWRSRRNLSGFERVEVGPAFAQQRRRQS